MRVLLTGAAGNLGRGLIPRLRGGIHTDRVPESEFWRLNVDGTFWALQAARENRIGRFLFLSPQAWHDRWGKYGFTKRIAEQLLDSVQLSLDYLEHTDDAALVVDAVHPRSFSTDQLANWRTDPLGILESGWTDIAYLPTRDFGYFVRQAAELGESAARAKVCDY